MPYADHAPSPGYLIHTLLDASEHRHPQCHAARVHRCDGHDPRLLPSALPARWVGGAHLKASRAAGRGQRSGRMRVQFNLEAKLLVAGQWIEKRIAHSMRLHEKAAKQAISDKNMEEKEKLQEYKAALEKLADERLPHILAHMQALESSDELTMR